MSAVDTYENVLERLTDPLERLHLDRLNLDRLNLDRLPDVEWPDIALDDVLDDVAVTVRRHPAATVAIIAITIVATCGVIWFVARRRRDAEDQTELQLAGVA